MKKVIIPTIVLIAIILTASFLFLYFATSNNAEAAPFYVGVTFGGNTTSEAKLLVDKVKGYTNLFVLQSGPISSNETAIDEICDYAVDAGLQIIVYFGKLGHSWQLPWIENAKQRWGTQFLGIYFYDEPAGSLLDNFTAKWQEAYGSHSSNSNLPENYDDMVDLFVDSWQTMPGLRTIKTGANPPTTFTSDYALYWFDYLAGYDIMLAQFGWNNSYIQDIALVRGAARMQNKSWGAIITWKYDKPPYLDSGEAIYNQMHAAYEAGAEYVIIFNYATQIGGNPYGTLTDEHFEALERFWNELPQNPRSRDEASQAEAALILPRNYGWGMRHPEDRIWGYWGPDAKSPQIWEISRKLFLQYGIRLDIVYDDPAFPVTGKYSRIYYWNQTI